MLFHRLLAFVWVLLGNSALVLADSRAGPWEVLFFYYAYQAEYNFRGLKGDDPSGSMIIGWNCKPSPPAKRACTFDEFLRAVYKSKGNYSLDKPFDLDAALKGNPRPTIDQLAVSLYNDYYFNGQNGGTKWDTPKLLRNSKVDWGIDMVFSEVNKVLQEINSASTVTDVDSLTKALMGAKKERLASTSGPNFDKIAKNMLKNQKITLKAITTTTPLGSTITEVDEEGSLAGLKGKKLTAANDALTKQIAAVAKTGSAKHHAGIIDTYDTIANDLAELNEGCA